MTQFVLAAREFPRVAEYIRDLPAGLASHPEAEMKASFYRGALEDKPLSSVASKLPPVVAELILRPRLVSTWVQSTYVQAVYLAIADHYGMTDPMFRDWSYHVQSRLLAGPIYRALGSLASPSMLLEGARLRWRSAYRGTEIEVTSSRKSDAVLTMRFPDGLYAKTNLSGFAGGLRALAEVSNGRLITVETIEMGRTSAIFSIQWR